MLFCGPVDLRMRASQCLRFMRRATHHSIFHPFRIVSGAHMCGRAVVAFSVAKTKVKGPFSSNLAPSAVRDAGICATMLHDHNKVSSRPRAHASRAATQWSVHAMGVPDHGSHGHRTGDGGVSHDASTGPGCSSDDAPPGRCDPRTSAPARHPPAHSLRRRCRLDDDAPGTWSTGTAPATHPALRPHESAFGHRSEHTMAPHTMAILNCANEQTGVRSPPADPSMAGCARNAFTHYGGART
jgi:hypothetical protein